MIIGLFALALAILMTWAGHTYTLSVASKQPAWEIAQVAYHAHDEQAEVSRAARITIIPYPSSR